jgi:hypothetical protein
VTDLPSDTLRTRYDSTIAAARIAPALVALLYLLLCLGFPGSAADVSVGAASPAGGIDFARDVLPLLSDNCFPCHGPDSNTRKARLRLDTREGAFGDRGNWAPVVAGKPGESAILERIRATDPLDLMPPAKSHLSLSEAEKDLISQWIEEGANWSKHWSYAALERPALPEVSDPSWPRNGIDHFIMSRFDVEGLLPAPTASDDMLLRRLTLDLTGLPPTPGEREFFRASSGSDRWNATMARLFDSPHYGQRMAWPWLDAARYADSNGYQGDLDRTAWPWRDWVVRAFNDNLPFDKFTIWQLAGDLLEDPTDEQILATGFLRHHMINGEGGRIPEENRVEYIFDQLETVGTTWLGMTMNCCRCHDHKFDPLSNQNYYQLFAFFNQTEVTGGGGSPRTAPVLAVPSPEQMAAIAALQKKGEALEVQRAERDRALASEANTWESAERGKLEESPWSVLVPASFSSDTQDLTLLGDNSILASGANPDNDTYRVLFSGPSSDSDLGKQAQADQGSITGLRLEALRHESMTYGGMGRSNSGNFVLTSFEVRVLAPGVDDTGGRVIVRNAVASIEGHDNPVDGALDGNESTGWAVWRGEPIDRDHEAVFLLDEPLHLAPHQQLEITLRHDSRHKSHNLGRFRLSATSVPGARLESERAHLHNILATPAAQRGDEQDKLLKGEQRRQDEAYGATLAKAQATARRLGDLQNDVPEVMVMADTAEFRRTFVLQKGIYNQPMEEVWAGVPEFLLSFPRDSKADRLGLARWIVSPANPLTARVIVNRLWAQVFGTGLSRTVENIGSQGEPPTHPELLDWLATEFIQSSWNVKHIMRLMLDSATYRQTSARSAELQALDPKNRLLARAPRFRMPSWMIRDQALWVSGLLVDQPGGPGSHPYQPEGVWEEYTFGTRSYPQGKGDDLYRRSIYTFWRRIVGPTPFFDAATRKTCAVVDRRTNTPLHALATLNDITYVEAARTLAERLLLEGVASDGARIQRAFLLVLARNPALRELELLGESLDRLRSQYAADPGEARSLLQVGDSERDASLEAVEHAAWTGLALTLLNLDETVTRE